MDLKQIEYILAIAEEQSISRAAEKLFITQPALNQQLLKLEKQLGTLLFERKKHTMIPTYVGSIYLDACRQIINIRKDTYKLINNIINEEAGLISVAYTSRRGAEMFSKIYPHFHARYPKVLFHIREGNVKDMEQMLLKHEVDMAFSLYLADQKKSAFEYTDLHTEPVVLAMPVTHHLAHMAGKQSYKTLPEIDIHLLKDSDFIFSGKTTLVRDLTDSMFSNVGFFPNILFETLNTATIISIVKQQLACAFIPGSYIDPDAPIVYFSVAPNYHWTQCMIKLPETILTKPEQYLLKLAKLHSMKLLPEFSYTP